MSIGSPSENTSLLKAWRQISLALRKNSLKLGFYPWRSLPSFSGSPRPISSEVSASTPFSPQEESQWLQKRSIWSGEGKFRPSFVLGKNDLFKTLFNIFFSATWVIQKGTTDYSYNAGTPFKINIFKVFFLMSWFSKIFFQNISILSNSSLQNDELKHLMGLIYLNINKFKFTSRENRIKKHFYFHSFFSTKPAK